MIDDMQTVVDFLSRASVNESVEEVKRINVSFRG